jgi:hypothetical protein
MRTTFETEQDIKNEGEISLCIEKQIGEILTKEDKYSLIDRAVYINGKMFAAFEIKHRNYEFGFYPIYMMDKRKIDYMKSLNEKGISAYLVIRFSTVIRFMQVTHNNYRTGKKGRTDRGDVPGDVEGVYYIPLSEMILLNKLEGVI